MFLRVIRSSIPVSVLCFAACGAYGSDDPPLEGIRDITWATAAPLHYSIKGPVVGVLDDKLVVSGGTQIPTAVLEKYRAHFKRKDMGHGYYMVVDAKDSALAARIHAEMRVCGGSMVTDRTWLLDPRTGQYEDLPAAPASINWPFGISANNELYVLPELPCIDNGKETLASREVWRLSRRTGAWKWDQLPPCPMRASGPASLSRERR